MYTVQRDATRQFCRVGSGGVNWVQKTKKTTRQTRQNAARLSSDSALLLLPTAVYCAVR